MREFLSAILFFALINIAQGQIHCGSIWPVESTKSDTISTFIFLNKTIKVTSIQNAKPTSNYSFKTKIFDFSWISIHTIDTESFINQSLNRLASIQIIDTLNCNLFGQNHQVIAYKWKKKTHLVFYLNQSGHQDVFLATLRNPNKINQVIGYLETNLSE